MHPPFTLDPDGATLNVRVTPKASRTAAAGTVTLADGSTALAIRIAAPPVEGAANAELLRFLARQLGVGRGAVSLVAGQAARMKRVRVTGDAGALAPALARLADAG